MIISKSKRLYELYSNHNSCGLCLKAQNKLNHIYGIGKESKPRFILLLINPTYRNISSNPDSNLYQVPFVGVRGFYEVLGKAGIISEWLIKDLKSRKAQDWDNELIVQINNELIEKSFFVTNLVKCCFDNPAYPQKDYINYNLELLKKELEIINPQNIIAMGAFPYKILTGEDIKLGEVYNELINIHKVVKAKTNLGLTQEINVLPCYFPVGRGNPKRAGKMINWYTDI